MADEEGKVEETPPKAEVPAANEAPATEEETLDSGLPNWDELLDDDQEEETSFAEVPDEGEKAKEIPPAEELKEEPPKEEVKAEEPKPAEEIKEGEETSPEVPKAEEVKPPAEEPKTQTAEERAAMRTDAEEELTKHFALDEEDAETLRENPAEVFPKMAAKLYLDLYENVVNGVMSSLPKMIQAVESQAKVQTQAEDAFYGKWEKLNTEAGRLKVAELGASYRYANPNVGLDQFIQDVGIQASIALQLPIEGYAPTLVEEPSPAPGVPSSPPAASTVPGVSTVPSNQFEALAEEIIEDER